MGEKYIIPIGSEKTRFQNHINIEGNNRIMFSGYYGSGKTFFLNDFFNTDQYEAFFLSPINYSIASNEDIFEYIKYDLAIQLFSRIKFEELSLNKDDISKYYIQNNIKDILLDIIKHCGKLGKTISDIAGDINRHLANIDKLTKDIAQTDQDKIGTYLEMFEFEKGSIYEYNIISQIIDDTIEQVKEGGKEVVLIIDDIDRVDPAHIFRLLNVFSAHFNNDHNINNKFGFDKVVLVCDIKNIRNLFHNFYGDNVDFSGYIDKFYSKQIYNFDNTTNIFRSFQDYYYENLDSESWILRGYKDNLVYVYDIFITYKLTNIRKLLKFEREKLEMLNYRTRPYFNAMSHLIFTFISFLSGINNELLIHKFEGLKEILLDDCDDIKNLVTTIMPYVDNKVYGKRGVENNIHEYSSPSGFIVNYIIKKDGTGSKYVEIDNFNNEKVPVFELLKIGYESYLNISKTLNINL